MARMNAIGRPKPKLDHPGKLFARVMGYVFKNYLPHCILVLICIVTSVLCNLQGTLFTRNLVDDYIKPFLLTQNPDFGPLGRAILRVAGFYLLGIIAGYVNQLLMVYVTQGTQRRIREDMFDRMERLPIKYFDTHAHGDIMSIYTNDIDTMRQMISQSIPQCINSAITIVATLVSMIVLSGTLTVTTLLMVGLMLWATGFAAKRSSRNFVEQQKRLGKVNGYIEEMMNGQKVVKVFCHEEESKAQFKELNDALFESADKANTYANVLGPINAQLGNLSYVVCAVVGGALALNGIGGLTVGGLITFLMLNRGFTMPINQVSQQFNAIIMALAGADRIFKLMDEKPETDDGYVTLVGARGAADGKGPPRVKNRLRYALRSNCTLLHESGRHEGCLLLPSRHLP